MRLRAARRAVALVFVLALMFFRYWAGRLRGPYTMERRALWMQDSALLVMACLGIQFKVEGAPPTHGLVVSNHLSYLDIVILSAAAPCYFVAKAEIGGWPYFGEAARSGGTIFLDRSSRSSAHSVASEIAQRLRTKAPVLFFPEGTTTDGSHLLPFRTWLFEPAVAAGTPVTAASIRYVIADGTPESELCWYGDAGFLPHLWKALGTAGFCAEVKFGEPHVYPHRRTAAAATQAEVEAMRNAQAVVA